MRNRTGLRPYYVISCVAVVVFASTLVAAQPQLAENIAATTVVAKNSMLAEVSDRRNGAIIGAFAPASLWRFTGLSDRIIFVCWESPATAWPNEKEWVKTQILQTWGTVSAIRFEGWNTCENRSAGVRILISDGRNGGLSSDAGAPMFLPGGGRTTGFQSTGLDSQVFAYGRFLDGVQNGMVLDFGLGRGAAAQQQRCVDVLLNAGVAADDARKSCIIHVATHMFGHALGLRHPEPPLDPDMTRVQASEYSSICPDPKRLNAAAHPEVHSVMSDCGVTPGDMTQLSATDIVLIKRVYCEINPDVCKMQDQLAPAH